MLGGAASLSEMASGPYADHFQLPCLNRSDGQHGSPMDFLAYCSGDLSGTVSRRVAPLVPSAVSWFLMRN
jgi:hypothetical protein